MRRFSIYWSLCENGFEKFYLKIFSNYQTYLSNLLRRRSIKSSDWLFGSRESRESNSSQILVVRVWMVTYHLTRWNWLSLCVLFNCRKGNPLKSGQPSIFVPLGFAFCQVFIKMFFVPCPQYQMRLYFFLFSRQVHARIIFFILQFAFNFAELFCVAKIALNWAK